MARTLAEIADDVGRVSVIYAERNGIRRDDDWYVLKLAEEAGELVAEHLRSTGRGRARAVKGESDLADEAADLLAHTLLFCRHNGIDVEAALERKWFRYLPEGSR
jgi:NTP pyrophosphatase (non-canonical NTP hydrolase)